MPELDHYPEHESHYDCEFCRDTGKLDGSDYYDCAHCSIAQERVKLEERMTKMKRSMPTNDAMWSLVKSERKRVLAMQAAELALLKSKLLQAERRAAQPVVLSDDMRNKVRDAIAAALGEAMDCTRVWSAWSYGTMGPDDFSVVANDEDRLEEVVDAALNAILAAKEQA